MGARYTAVLLLAAAGCSSPIELDWTYEIGAGSVSTPLVTDSFIAFGSELGVHVVELDGSPRCVFDSHGEVISSPKTDGNLIFFGSTNYIFYAIEPTCVEAWKFTTSDRIKSDPLVSDGRVYASSYDGHLYALKAKNGKEIWRFPARPKIEQPAPEEEPEPEADKKKKKKKKKEAEPEPEPEEAPPPPPEPIEVGDFSYSSPVLANGVIFLGNLDHHLYAIDAKTGTMRFRYKTMGPVTSTPLIHEGVAYFGSNDGNVYALDLKAGRLRWKLTTKEWVNSSARIDGETLYIGGNDRHVYAINTANGEARWSFDSKGPMIAIPLVYKNLVIAAGSSGDGNIYALQASDGSVFWQYETGGKVDSDPVLVGNRFYVTSTDQNLYAFVIEKTTVD